MKKFILITLISIAVIFILLVVIGFFIGSSIDELTLESKKEAEEFAKTANKEQCLEKYVDKYIACDDLSCYSSSAAFGVICLAAATGSKDEFCSNKPKSETEFYEGDWKQGLCKSKGLDTSRCLHIFKVIDTHCAN